MATSLVVERFPSPGQVEQSGGVLAENLAPGLGGEVGRLSRDNLIGVGPGAIGVGEVGSPHHVAVAEEVDEM